MGWGYFERSRPRAAKGGIKSQSKRGTFGESWWAQRWLETLQSFDLGARLTRGRSYARGGQVLAVDVGMGQVKAKVQGSRPKPYSVTIQVRALSGDEWHQVVAALSGQAIYAAKLLAGEMPPDIESIFQGAGFSLFPQKLADLTTDCSCPDWSNPCKHVAAVYYLLAEEFDRDPFLLFRLRGMSREDLVAALGAAGAPDESAASAAVEAAPEPLPADSAMFWNGEPLSGDPAALFGDARTPPVAAPLLKRLGAFPFWRGAVPIAEALEPVYARGSSRGIDLFTGDYSTKGDLQ